MPETIAHVGHGAVLDALATRLFGEEPERVRPVRQGLAAAVYAVRVAGKRLMVKLYDDVGQASWFEELVPLMRRVGTDGVPVPRVLHHGLLEGQWAYLVYEQVPGVSLREYRGDHEAVWRAVGRYAARVNALAGPGYGRTRYGAHGGCPFAPSWCAYVAPEIERILDALRAIRAPGLDEPFVARVAARLDELPGWRFEPRVVHANLSDRNIIVDPAGGAVQAIIDWDSAYYAPAPHAELATALLWMTEASARGFLDGYGMSGAAYRAIAPQVETLRLLVLARYLHWHLLHGREELVRAICEQMAIILGGTAEDVPSAGAAGEPG